MHLMVNGQQAFCPRVLEAISIQGKNVVAVHCGPERHDQSPAQEAYWELKMDLCVREYVLEMASFNQPLNGLQPMD